MKELETEFTGKGQVKGFMFTQKIKTENAYMYEVYTGNSYFYEVFERKENTRFNCVSYPNNNAFGLWAKTTDSYEKAIELLEHYDLRVELRKSNV